MATPTPSTAPRSGFDPISDPDPARAVKGLRVAWVPRLGNQEVDHETLRLCREEAFRLADLGAEVEEIAAPFRPLEEAFLIFQRSGLAARFGSRLEEFRDRLDRSLVMAIEAGFEIPATKVQEAIQLRTGLYHEVREFFDKYDLLVSPTVSRPALSADHRAWEEVEINGRVAGSLRSAWYSYTHPFNMTGQPALSIPCGWTGEGAAGGLPDRGPGLAGEDRAQGGRGPGEVGPLGREAPPGRRAAPSLIKGLESWAAGG